MQSDGLLVQQAGQFPLWQRVVGRWGAAASLRRLLCLAGLALSCVETAAWADSSLVSLGKTSYLASGSLFTAPFSNSSCSGCHYSADAPSADNALKPPDFLVVSDHHMGANNAAFIEAAFRTGGKMVAQIGAAIDSPSVAQRDVYKKISLYIGQFKAPAFSSAPTLRVASGFAGSRDIFPLLRADGTGGVAADTAGAGLTVTNSTGSTVVAASTNGGSATAVQNGVSATGTVATLAYNIGYQSPAQYNGSDTFYVKVANPTGSVTQAVSVTVLGISSAATVRGVKNTTYTAGAGALYKVTSSDSGATTFTASGLPTGLGINPSTGDITGSTTATGDFTVTVGATTTSATHSANGRSPRLSPCRSTAYPARRRRPTPRTCWPPRVTRSRRSPLRRQGSIP